MERRIQGWIEEIIIKSRYLLVPLFCALLFVIFTITYDFVCVLRHTIESSQLAEHTLQALELLDITMIANLIWLISAGSYYVFVDSHYPATSGKARPRCLAHISSGILKEKMAGSLIGVSSVHLLQTFLHLSESHETIEVQKIAVLIAIHIAFILGLLAFCHTNQSAHHNHDKEKENSHAPTH
jgi:uncharacterized protein (TIGR00645 family)